MTKESIKSIGLAKGFIQELLDSKTRLKDSQALLLGQAFSELQLVLANEAKAMPGTFCSCCGSEALLDCFGVCAKCA